MDIISRTQSICPICRRPVPAYYIREEGCCDMGTGVFFVQKCPDHGEFRTLASERADDFKEWIKHPVMNIPPQTAITRGDPEDASCPLHCGTCENHLQTACCVLIDVTDRCNQHCPYCFALSGEDLNPDEPTLEEMNEKFDWLLQQGEEGREFNIQLSGGEPTVRDDLPEIIRMARNKGFSYIQINSNGRRLAEEEGYARLLKEAGASVIFMQFDGTRDDIYLKLRGEALFDKKVQAIRNCEKAGLAVTLVPTVVRGVNDDNIGEMMDFLVANVNVVKGIHFQPASFFGRYPEGDELEGRITMFGLLRELEAQRPAFKYSDSLPISTGHTLCCFYSTYIKEPDGTIRCTLTNKQRQEGVSCCDTAGCCSTADCECQGSEPDCGVVSIGCCDMTGADKLEVIKKDRDYVLDKWDIAVPSDSTDSDNSGCCCSDTAFASKYRSTDEITDLDEFLAYYRRNTFTVTGMAFQDIANLDAERLKRCRVVQLTDDYRLIPFCAYNTLYR
ncbi:MAG: radical SAM protein [Lentihominibacter sp.]